MTAGTRVKLVAAVALWPAGSPGTVIGPSGPGLGRFDLLVELDAGGSLYFRYDELEPLELAASDTA